MKKKTYKFWDNFLYYFLFLQNQNKNKLTLLFHGFCLLLVTPKTTYKRQRGGESTIWGNTSREQQWANGNNNNKGAHFKQSK